jgi:flavodoxin
MKTLVIYHSAYGNTEKIAKAIGEAIGGEVQVVPVAEADASQLKGLNLLIVGSPTYGGRPTPPLLEFLGKVPHAALEGTRVAAFDTRMGIVFAKIFGYAAGKIADSLKKSGGMLAMPPEGFIVKGREGPLKEGELERAAKWAKEVAAAAQ